MRDYDKLVVLIQAYLNACKDFHYFCTDFSLHLLADEIMVDLDDVIDSIKENAFIAVGLKPLEGKEYAEEIAKATPIVKATNEANLRQLGDMAEDLEGFINGLKPDRRALNVILDNVADKIAHARTLINIELRKFSNVSEAVEKEECEGCVEKPIDRKEAKVADINYDKVADTVLNYSAQNIPEENTLDKLADKLGI